MLLSNSKKFISIDIPKTGTKTLRDVFVNTGAIDIYGIDWDTYCKQVKQTNIHSQLRLNPFALPFFYQHSTAENIKLNIDNHKKIFKKSAVFDFDTYETFTFIREPISRYLSFLNYSKQSEQRYLDKSHDSHAKNIEGLSCHRFFNKYTDPKKAFLRVIEREKSQDQYIFDSNQNLIVDLLLNFKDFENEIKKLFDMFDFNFNPTIRKLNLSTKFFNFEDVISDEALDLASKETDILNKLGFNF